MTKITTKYRFMGGVLLLLSLGLIAVFMSWKLAVSQEEREMIGWQNRLSVVLNGRADVITSWAGRQKNALELLSENTTLKLYLSNLSTSMGLEGEGQNALEEYILPLLSDRALQNGFAVSKSRTASDIKANVARPNDAGLALTNNEGRVIVATSAMPSVMQAMTSYMEQGANQDTLMVGPYEGEGGLATISIITPVFGIDEDENSPALGFLIGVRVLQRNFFDMLIQPGEVIESAENRLIYEKEGLIHTIQDFGQNSGQDFGKPDPDFIPPVDASLKSLASSYAFSSPGIMRLSKNYLGEDVLASSVNVAGTSWSLLRTIAAQEALGGVKDRKRNILILTALGIILFMATMVLIWRHGISVRLTEAVAKQKELTEKHEKLNKFMSVVTNSQPTEITVVNEQGKYTFANNQAGTSAAMTPEEMIGKTPTAIYGKARSEADEVNVEDVLEQNKPLTKLTHLGSGEVMRVFKTDYVPLLIDDMGTGNEKGVLIVKEDISEIEQTRLKRELSLKSLVSTLTMIIGSRDPYSRTHSERVVMVTKVLCNELNVDEATAATAELAGAMMNLGKILVPREILTKTEGLTKAELATIRSSMLKSADMIDGIEFEGPVAETLRQMQAHWDGTGEPKGLSGENILLPARVVAVSNAFVGMTSARAHRTGMDMRLAITILMDDADTIYDRRPVVSLMNYLENKGGFETWEKFGSSPDNL